MSSLFERWSPEYALNKAFTKDLFVLWLALAALICAGLNLNSSLNKLANKEE